MMIFQQYNNKCFKCFNYFHFHFVTVKYLNIVWECVLWNLHNISVPTLWMLQILNYWLIGNKTCHFQGASGVKLFQTPLVFTKLLHTVNSSILDWSQVTINLYLIHVMWSKQHIYSSIELITLVFIFSSSSISTHSCVACDTILFWFSWTSWLWMTCSIWLVLTPT